jgi:predicted amidophosphoribosyltransferase
MNKSSPDCPVCHDSVPVTATECPNCGAALVVGEIAPSVSADDQTFHCSRCQGEYQAGARFCPHCGMAFKLDAQDEVHQGELLPMEEGPVKAETISSKTSVEVVVVPPKPVRSKRSSSSVREEKVKSKAAPPPPDSVKILSRGYPVDSSLPYICPACGYGFQELEQDFCPACQNVVVKEKAVVEKEFDQAQIDDFISAFDQEDGLESPVLAYLYRKQVKPALLEKYEPVVQRWSELLSQGSVAIPGRVENIPQNLEQILNASRSVLRLARIWASSGVGRYAVLAEARAEINEYLRDLMSRAYQLLGRYHSWRGTVGTNYREMESAYKQSQRVYRQAVSLQSQKSTEVGLLNQSATELLKMVLSYPEKFKKIGNDKNPLTAQDAPGFVQDRQSYDDYLVAYPFLQGRVESCREQLKHTQQRFQQSEQDLKKYLRVLETSKERRLREIEEEMKTLIRMHNETVRDLPGLKAQARTNAFFAPVIIGLISMAVLFFSGTPSITAFGVGIGAVAFSYSQGFSKEVFHGQVSSGTRIWKWAGFFLLSAGLFPLIVNWLATIF